MVSGLNHYSLFCVSENKFVDTFCKDIPTNCPVDSTHIILPDTILEKLDFDVGIPIRQEYVKTGGNYRAESRSIVTEPNTTTTVEFNWPMAINVAMVKFITSSNMDGDIINSMIAPDSIIGVITQNVQIGDTIMSVYPTVLQYLFIGYYVKLDDGANVNDLGMILSIDSDNLKITFEKGTVNNFEAGSMVRMTICNILDFEIGPAGYYEFGSSHLCASYIPTGTIVKMTYKNNSNIDSKNLRLYYEYNY